MTIVSRRPGIQPKGAYAAEQDPKNVQAFNAKKIYIQGFRLQLNATGQTQLPISLNSAGRLFVGISLIPVSGLLTTLGDTSVTVTINNNNVLLAMGANNLVPNYVHSMKYFPVTQPLKGNDTINMLFQKNDAGSPFVFVNIFYKPQI